MPANTPCGPASVLSKVSSFVRSIEEDCSTFTSPRFLRLLFEKNSSRSYDTPVGMHAYKRVCLVVPYVIEKPTRQIDGAVFSDETGSIFAHF